MSDKYPKEIMEKELFAEMYRHCFYVTDAQFFMFLKNHSAVMKVFEREGNTVYSKYILGVELAFMVKADHWPRYFDSKEYCENFLELVSKFCYNEGIITDIERLRKTIEAGKEGIESDLKVVCFRN